MSHTGVVTEILSPPCLPLCRYTGGRLGREPGSRLGPGSQLGPTALLVGMDVRLQRQRRTVSPSLAHEKAPEPQNKGLPRLASPAQHLAWGLIEGNRASWSESEE